MGPAVPSNRQRTPWHSIWELEPEQGFAVPKNSRTVNERLAPVLTQSLQDSMTKQTTKLRVNSKDAHLCTKMRCSWTNHELHYLCVSPFLNGFKFYNEYVSFSKVINPTKTIFIEGPDSKYLGLWAKQFCLNNSSLPLDRAQRGRGSSAPLPPNLAPCISSSRLFPSYILL